MTKKEWINHYVELMEQALDTYRVFKEDDEIYSVIRRGIKLFGEEIGMSQHDFSGSEWNSIEDGELFIDKLKYALDCAIETEDVVSKNIGEPLIFLSHKSDDKKYGDALRNFIIGLGVKDNQLIYTSHPMHKIPLDVSIYDYLRKNITSNVFMIILCCKNLGEFI